MNKEKEVEAYLKNELPEEEKLKYEIAQELGVLDKVLEGGWKSLSAKETGRIGGLVASKRKENERHVSDLSAGRNLLYRTTENRRKLWQICRMHM